MYFKVGHITIIGMVSLLFNHSAILADATPVNIDEIRVLYRKAESDEKSCKELLTILSPYNVNNNSLFFGYKACATMLMAKHVFNPFSKWYYFKKGKQMLDMSIDADKNNVELRFLRFAIQTSVPSFLGYKNDIAEDKKIILASFYEIPDKNLKEMILLVLNNSKYLTSNEKQQLK